MRCTKGVIVTLVIFLTSGAALAQFIRDHESEGGLRGFHGPGASTRITRSFQSDAEARAEFERILSTVGLHWIIDRITLRASAETSNAEASIGKNGERFIFYNALFMQKVKQKTAEHWSLVSILAHEIGHHLAFHTEIAGRYHEFELEADYFSGFVLRRLGAILDHAHAAMRAISPKEASLTHPGLDQRLQAITLGWTDGGAAGVPSGLKQLPANQTASATLPQPPVPAPTIVIPREPLPPDIPVSSETLRVVEAHPFFANPPHLLGRSYDVISTESLGDGLATSNTKTTVQSLRRGLAKFDRINNEVTVRSGRKFTGTRRSTEVVGANGLVSLASIETFAGSGMTSTDRSTLIRIENMKGRIFPVEVGNRYSYDLTYQQVITSAEEFTRREVCEIAEKHEAKTLHSQLTGFAYIAMCDYQLRYKVSRVHPNTTHAGRLKSYFLEALGLWIDANGKTFRLSSFKSD